MGISANGDFFHKQCIQFVCTCDRLSICCLGVGVGDRGVEAMRPKCWAKILPMTAETTL